MLHSRRPDWDPRGNDIALFASTALVVTPDWQTLITATGGNAKWPAFYDGRYNVTNAAGVASSWGDVRGGGFGPAITGTGTQQPSYGGDHLVFDGVNNVLSSTAVALFSLGSVLTLIWVGIPMTSASNGRIAVAINSDAGIPSANSTQIGTAANPDITAKSWKSPGAVNLDMGIAADNTTVRLAAASNINGTPVVKGTIANHATQTLANTANTAGNNALVIGASWQSPVGGLGASTCYALGVYSGDIVADGNLGAVMTWATAYRSATAAV